MNITNPTVPFVGWAQEDPCACTPINADAATFAPDTFVVGVDSSWTTAVEGTSPVIERVELKPEWLTITINGSDIVFSGKPTEAGKASGVVVLSNECSDCTIIPFDFTVTKPCVKQANITQDLSASDGFVQFSKEVESGTVIGATTLPAGVSVAVYETQLSITGTPPGADEVSYPLSYSIEVVSPCNTFTISGSITTKAVEPPCVPITLGEITGSPTFVEGEPNTYCQTYTGTTATVDELPALPPGLRWELSPGKVCITGTLLPKPCATSWEPVCEVYTLTLVNECSKMRAAMSVQAEYENPNKPVFCMGTVIATPTDPASPNVYAWKVTARWFPANTKVTIWYGYFGSALGAPDDILTDNEITVDGTGFGETTVQLGPTGSGCRTLTLYASHPTCAVATNFSPLTRPFNVGNECTSSSGAGGFSDGDGGGAGEGPGTGTGGDNGDGGQPGGNGADGGGVA